MPIGIIASLDHEARGITRQDGKAIFVDGALPGEVVEYASFRKKSKFELANLVRVIKPSNARVVARCPHFGVCGGCAMQHMDPSAQVAAKQRVLEDSLWHMASAEEIHRTVNDLPTDQYQKTLLSPTHITDPEHCRSYRDTLSSEVIEKINNDHAVWLARYGYE